MTYTTFTNAVTGKAAERIELRYRRAIEAEDKRHNAALELAAAEHEQRVTSIWGDRQRDFQSHGLSEDGRAPDRSRDYGHVPSPGPSLACDSCGMPKVNHAIPPARIK